MAKPMGRRMWGILVFVAGPCWAGNNQIDFILSRGYPLSSVQTIGSSDRDGSRGTAWSADILHAINSRVSWGLGGGHFRSNDNVSQTFVPNTLSTITSKTTSILALTRTDFTSGSALAPYFIVGVGWARNSLSVAASPGGAFLDDSHNAIAYSYGVGLDYALNDRLVIGVEARYQGSLNTTFELTPAGTAATGQRSVESAMNLFTAGVKAGVKY